MRRGDYIDVHQFTREEIHPLRGPVEEEERKEVVVEEVVFTHENRGGSAQHATRATPTRSSHGPVRAEPCAIPIYSSAVTLWRSSTSPCLRPAEWGELPDRCRSVGVILRFVLEKVFAYCATVVLV